MARIKNKDSFLVTQYLGVISSKALKKYADNRHGIFALYNGDKLDLRKFSEARKDERDRSFLDKKTAKLCSAVQSRGCRKI